VRAASVTPTQTTTRSAGRLGTVASDIALSATELGRACISPTLDLGNRAIDRGGKLVRNTDERGVSSATATTRSAAWSGLVHAGRTPHAAV